MIEANKAVFKALDDFCNARGSPLVNSGATRWIKTTDKDKEFLKSADPKLPTMFTRRKGLIRFENEDHSFFTTVGFDSASAPHGLAEIDIGAGLLTATLFELNPLPAAGPDAIRNIVEADDRESNAEFQGFDSALISSLYPAIRSFVGKDIARDDEETWRVYFLLCLSECKNDEFWISDDFASTLEGIASLDQLNIPYKTLCRSIFDTDPGAMFLALYRCLEALYAFSSAQKLVRNLKLSTTWAELAVALEHELGWHPREEASLAELVLHGIEPDHKAVFDALKETIPSVSSSLSAAAGRRIYRLRNDLVHYRPAQHMVPLDQVDWNKLCNAVAGMVCFVYAKVFEIST